VGAENNDSPFELNPNVSRGVKTGWANELSKPKEVQKTKDLNERANRKSPDERLAKKNNLGSIQELCFTPHDLFGSDRKKSSKEDIIKLGDSDPNSSLDSLAAGFGQIAEVFIAEEFLKYYAEMKINPLKDVYNDYSFAGYIDKGYVNFLKLKNVGLSDEAKSGISESSLRRPDILIDNGVYKKFYEIKPDSKGGRYDGKNKIKTISEYFTKYGLDYKIGDELRITEIKIGDWSLKIAGRDVRVEMSFSLRYVKGVILYKLCIKTNWEFIIAEDMTFMFLKSIYMWFADQIIAIRDFKNKLSEQIKELPIADIATLGVGLIFIIVVLEIVPLLTTALLFVLAEALAISAVSLKSFVIDELKFQNSGESNNNGRLT
jgi:hypothetical protein